MYKLNIERVFSVSAERLFDAWTVPEQINAWFGPENFEVIESKVDFKVSGRYSIVIRSPDNRRIEHYGEYLEIKRPTSLVFTWILSNQDCQGSENQHETTLVSLRFESINATRTKLLLEHEQLPDKAALDGHEFGWESSLNSLTTFLNNA